MLTTCLREYNRRAGCCPTRSGGDLDCCGDDPSVPLNLTTVMLEPHTANIRVAGATALLALVLAVLVFGANGHSREALTAPALRLLAFHASENAPRAAATGDSQHQRIELFDTAKGVCSYYVVLFHAAVMFAKTRGKAASTIRGWSGLLLLLHLVIVPSLYFCSGAVAKAAVTPKRTCDLDNNRRTLLCAASNGCPTQSARLGRSHRTTVGHP